MADARRTTAIDALIRLRCDLLTDQLDLLQQPSRPSLYRHGGCVVFTGAANRTEYGDRFHQMLSITDPSLLYRSNAVDDMDSKRTLCVFASLHTLPKVETLDVMLFRNCVLRMYHNAPQGLINFGPGTQYTPCKAIVFSRAQYQEELDICRRDAAHVIRLEPSWRSDLRHNQGLSTHADCLSAALSLFRWFDDEKVRRTVSRRHKLHPDAIAARHQQEEAAAAATDSDDGIFWSDDGDSP